VDRIGEVRAKINVAKEAMIENIDSILERGDKIELLVEKTELLADEAMVFERHATKLKKHMWCKACRTTAILVAIGLTLAFVVSAYFCGGPLYPKCRAKASSAAESAGK